MGWMVGTGQGVCVCEASVNDGYSENFNALP